MTPVQCKHPLFVKRVDRKEKEPRCTHQFASRGPLHPKRNANKTVVILTFVERDLEGSLRGPQARDE